MAVVNSEVTKKREALQKRLENVQRWAAGARKRTHNASKLYIKRCKLTKERAEALYRVLNEHQREMQRQGVEYGLRQQTLKEEQRKADAEIEEYRRQQWKAYETSNTEFAKCNQLPLRLPDGRYLSFTICSACCVLAAQKVAKIP
jgi:hypothetical protein